MALFRMIALFVGMLSVGGCASLIEGTTQKISVDTDPPDARCIFWRNGMPIADIAATPNAVRIRKTRDDLTIVCSKPGYASASYLNRSGIAGATFANVLTAGLSWAVDSTTGADNKYDGQVRLSLAPLPPGSPTPSAAPPPPEPPPPPTVTAPPPRAPAVAPVSVPPQAELNCAAADGSRIRVTGSACPAGWTPAR
jgi:hypothetical protein